MTRVTVMSMPKRTRQCGFTLIELLMVMAIICVLIALLVPTLTSAMTAVKKFQTVRILKVMSTGVELFRDDFKVYPPSAPAGTTGRGVTGQMETGAANIAFYLRGPVGMGWGTGGGGGMPFAGRTPDRAYGPYYEALTDDVIRMRPNPNDPKQAIPVGFLDAFKGLIFYFRSDAAAVTTSPPHPCAEDFFVRDNNPLGVAANTDPKVNYAADTAGGGTQDTAFNDANAIMQGTAVYKYKRSNYLLVSPGPDGCYGYVKTNPSDPNGPLIPAAGGTGALLLDDLTN